MKQKNVVLIFGDIATRSSIVVKTPSGKYDTEFSGDVKEITEFLKRHIPLVVNYSAMGESEETIPRIEFITYNVYYDRNVKVANKLSHLQGYFTGLLTGLVDCPVSHKEFNETKVFSYFFPRETIKEILTQNKIPFEKTKNGCPIIKRLQKKSLTKLECETEDTDLADARLLKKYYKLC